MLQLLIADDHSILLDGFYAIFRSISDIQIAGTAKNGNEVLEIMKHKKIDVVLMDINMPEKDGMDTCKIITKKYPEAKVIALSMYKKPSYIKIMKENGAKGYLLKDDAVDEILDAIRTVHMGDVYYSKQMEKSWLSKIFAENRGVVPVLTKREKEVLLLIAKGLSNKDIADQLFISAHTVISHRKNMISKFNVKNSAELVKETLDQGII